MKNTGLYKLYLVFNAFFKIKKVWLLLLCQQNYFISGSWCSYKLGKRFNQIANKKIWFDFIFPILFKCIVLLLLTKRDCQALHSFYVVREHFCCLKFFLLQYSSGSLKCVDLSPTLMCYP